MSLDCNSTLKVANHFVSVPELYSTVKKEGLQHFFLRRQKTLPIYRSGSCEYVRPIPSHGEFLTLCLNNKNLIVSLPVLSSDRNKQA